MGNNLKFKITHSPFPAALPPKVPEPQQDRYKYLTILKLPLKYLILEKEIIIK